MGLTDPLSTSPKTPFLKNVLFALSKRRKAIRHKVRRIEVERVVERSVEAEREKLEVACDIIAAGALRLFIWEDRWVFLDARTRGKESGWAWEFTCQGRLIGHVDPGKLVQALENSIEAAAEQSTAALQRVWVPLIAAGPRPIP